MSIDMTAPTTGARLLKADCAKYKCACLPAGEQIRNGDLVFVDNATSEVFSEFADGREFVGLSVSCVCNETDDCVAVEYQKAHIDETEFAVPFDDATFDPTGMDPTPSEAVTRIDVVGSNASEGIIAVGQGTKGIQNRSTSPSGSLGRKR